MRCWWYRTNLKQNAINRNRILKKKNFGKFIYQFLSKTKTLIRKLERILIKLYRQNVFLLFIQTATLLHTHTYIYSHPQTDCFVLSELFSVARHAGRSKPGSKPDQLYVRLSFRLGDYEYMVQWFQIWFYQRSLFGRALSEIFNEIFYLFNS